MQRDSSRYRGEVVGSFLRPATIKQACEQFQHGEIDAVAVRRIEDETIRDLVTQQRACGLRVVTDGEFRRAWWYCDFLRAARR